MLDTIKQILIESVHAPSGDNSQPWQFKISENSIQVINIPTRDNHIFNFRQWGSYIAHGALLENIKLTAQAYGYIANINLFPVNENRAVIANITLEQSNKQETDLYKVIPLRSTNRTKYHNKPITSSELHTLTTSIEQFTSINLHWSTNKSDIARLAQASSVAEQTMLEYKDLHDLFFNYIRWSKAEEQAKPGLYIETLELDPPQKLVFKLLRSWKITNFLNKTVGISKFIAKENCKVYTTAPAIGLLTSAKLDDSLLVTTGHATQHLWLQATSMGLSIQPLSGMLYLAHRIHGGEPLGLSQQQQKNILEAYTTVCSVFNITTDKPLFMFRIGYASKPSAQSYYQPPTIINN